MSKPAVEGGGDSADGVLEEGQAVFEFGRVEGCDAHEDILQESVFMIFLMEKKEGLQNVH